METTVDPYEERRDPDNAEPEDRSLFIRVLMPILIAALVVAAAIIGRSVDYDSSNTLPCSEAVADC